ncbi:glycosyltransferase [Dyadobacter psychrotolerans]|uniref:Glycosyltransferase n=1 Tax=Dyadobacter psychrotolerans TaxID=2541721 RepID=A0A4R5DM34_9BACT|nr:glycosyltransferase [Dyadobacter psychrotolerans]TDE13134.1 glycosyltransferase [Dyadobacter psychrotolerans]
MTSAIKFSVLLPLYFKEDTKVLTQCFESLLEQTLPVPQVVLVIDGPVRDELLDVVARFKPKFLSFKILQLPENRGLANACNVGILECDHELIARMDTDDICYPQRFHEQIPIMHANPSLSALGSATQEFNHLPGDLGIYRQPPTSIDKIRKWAKFRNPINHPSVVFRKSDVLKVGGYRVDLVNFDDYFLWITLLQKGYQIENLKISLVHCRIGNDMIGRRQGWTYLKYELQFLAEARKLGFLNFSQQLISIFTRIPSRILPKSILQPVYLFFLRNNKK